MTPESLSGLAASRWAGATLPGLPSSRDEAFKYTPVHRLLSGVPERCAELRCTATGPVDSGPAVAPDDAWSALSSGAHRVVAGEVSLVHELVGEGVGGSSLDVEATGAVQVVERFVGGGDLAVPRCTVRVADGASVVHVRVVDTADPVRHLGRVVVELGKNASYRLVSIVAGGAIARVGIEVRFLASGGSAELHGLSVLDGTRHADHHVTVRHDAPSCTSRQAFRALIGGRARSVFTGRVVVRRGAGGTDAGQVHRALLLSETAVANARPQLEIHHDDVKASHGTAVGSLDEESLFYLRQRGLDAVQARTLLVGAFAAEVLAAVPEPLRAGLEADLARWTVRS